MSYNLTTALAVEEKSKSQKKTPTSYKILAGLGITVILAAFIGGGIALGIIYCRPSQSEPSRDFVYQRAAVAADAAGCSEIGRDVLTDGGGAIDAAIAGLLCVGLYNPHSAGIGGGSFTLYYDKHEGTAHFWDSREKAPLAAHRDMYFNKSEDASTVGGLAIGVPGEIKGYWEAHQMFGKLPWRRLFEPSIELAENGLIVSPELEYAISRKSEIMLSDESLREVFTDGNGNLLAAGDTLYQRKLGNTLRKIADNGASEFYNGSIAETIAAEVQNRGGIITVEDLAAYSVEKRTPLSFRVNDMTVYSGRPPCSGAVYALILNILEGYDFTPDSIGSLSNKVLTYHRIIEAFKFAYAKRSALGDESFVNITELVANMTSQTYADGLRARINDDRTYNYTYYDPEFQIVNDGGTSHISIVDQEGNAASVTSTINTHFGSKVRGNITGIIFNNEMDDFSKPGENNYFGVPPSEANFIVPGKRPLSSMAPVIIVDGNGHVRFVVGASGGTRITTATSLVSMETLWFGSSLVDAVERKRVHHQLVPQYFNYEPTFPSDIMEGLEVKGHEAKERSKIGFVQAIKRLEDDWLEAHCDSRKGGRPAGF
ncbi:glutathione hydrolase 1 proenzyme-like [Diadema antillarum]|uniref:glutathione hydrolase 1 proenzyme-like n=1 Tax=Diadema antillarum TaxID=105358 RepID=UPI003A8B0D9E